MHRLLLIVLVSAVAVAHGPAADDLPAVKVDFPDVAGFKKTKPRTFDKKELGYSIAYDSTDSDVSLAVTTYVYTGGKASIPDGGKSDEVTAEMGGIVKGIQFYTENGTYKSYKETDSGVKPLGAAKGAPQAAWKRFDLVQKDGTKTVSEAYLLGYKNHFVKLRVTYPADRQKESEKALATVLDGIGAAVK